MSSSRDSVMNVISMNGGDGEFSYATNSRHQRNVISKTRPVVEENIQEMLRKFNFPKCIKVADLGCSSGQNTFMTMFQIVNTITRSYQLQTSQNSPEIDYCLNDLPENDFNSSFKLVPSFKEKVKGNCFVSGVPGSFYSRIFSKESLHFLHSSYSVHWLSKVPQGLEDDKKSVYIKSGCSLNMCKSYMNQFQDDFSLFLRLRSKEMVPNGRMILTIIGKNDLDPLAREGFFPFSILSDSLVDLVSEGILKESEVESFNLPFYNPNEGEVKDIVVNEGSFEINKIETHELLVSYKTDQEQEDEDEDEDDYNHSHGIEVGKKMASIIRSITEPMLVAHFGDMIIIDRIFDKFADNATKYYLKFPRHVTVNIIVSLIRK